MSSEEAKTSSVEVPYLSRKGQTYDEKVAETKPGIDIESLPEGELEEPGNDLVLDDARDITTHVITVEDDPSLNPWTFRAFFLGMGLSAFGGVLGKCFNYVFPAPIFTSSQAEIYYFKPVSEHNRIVGHDI